MKRMLGVLAIAFTFVAAGCHAQVPQTTFTVNVTWTAPPVCTVQAPCAFQVSRLVSTASPCPAATGQYAFLSTTASQAVTFSDTTVVSGQSYCYVLQTTQAAATGAASVPTNNISVPANPVAPTAPAVQISVQP
jgi:hypothetical protein